jgi:hypothetical protein
MFTLRIERRRHLPGFEADIAAHPVKRGLEMKAITRRKNISAVIDSAPSFPPV